MRPPSKTREETNQDMKDAYTKEASQVLKETGSDPQRGLTEEQAARSRAQHGANTFTRESHESMARRVWEAATEPMILMLIFAAIITLGVNIARFFTGGEYNFLECAGIFTAISLSVVITIITEGKSAKAFEALNQINEDTLVKALRAGEPQLIAQKEIVVGDILLVETGDKLVADGRLIESNDLSVDESSLTGESLPVNKSADCVCPASTPVAERANMLYSGCFVASGSARLVVTAVGNHTEFGQIARELSTIEKSSTPLVKMRVVKALKAQQHVVAVTGDGINDAPAIKNADVGIAMGIAGSEVTKEASDIVLLDDSFATIIKAIQWGRAIYENFKRFIQFQLTVNVSSVIVVIASILAGFTAPFTALELLWINIIMDGPPALTLGLEPIREDLLNRPPTKRSENIISKKMLARIFANGIYISVIFMLQHFTNFLNAAPEQESTVLFTLFVVFQLFNAFNCRELDDTPMYRNLFNNRLMLGVFVLVLFLQVAITQVGGAVFETVPLSLGLWAKILGVSCTVVILNEGVKAVRRSISR